MEHLAVLAAMGMEAKPFIEKIKDKTVQNIDGRQFIVGKIGDKQVAVHCSGMGMKKAAKGTEALIKNFAPEAIILYGVSGGLIDIALADTVVATESFPCSGKAWEEGIAAPADKELTEHAAELLGARKSVVATSQGLIFNKKRKERIVARSNAVCIDMESYAVLTVAERERVKAVVLRCISDTKETKSLLSFFKNGRIAAEKAAGEAEKLILSL
jgi:nucleoside phosphorylase